MVLNTANEAELMKLPGVGKKKAQAILALREKLGGRFKRIEDLTRVRGLKRKALAKIRPLVILDAEDRDRLVRLPVAHAARPRHRPRRA